MNFLLVDNKEEKIRVARIVNGICEKIANQMVVPISRISFRNAELIRRSQLLMEKGGVDK